MSSLPDPRRLITDILASIPEPSGPASQANPLSSLSSTSTAKETFLTLHVLFPNELLPALDLLDRGLVTRLRIASPMTSKIPRDEKQQSQADPISHPDAPVAPDKDAPALNPDPSSTTSSPNPPNNATLNQPSTYYVHSAQQPSRTHHSNSRYRPAATSSPNSTSYEVRPQAWTCSCPAFAFSAFPASAAAITANSDAEPPAPAPPVESPPEWSVGGLTRDSNGHLPICKHLLACVLVQHTAMFASFVEDRSVSVEEMGGWAAGWGD